jgi:carboxymethylenebutenolidase
MKELGTQRARGNHPRFATRESFTLGLYATVLIFVAVSLFAFVASLPAAEPAQEAPPNASSETIHLDSGGFDIDALVVKPAGGGKHPAILLIHDSQGLDDSIRKAAKQFANAGFFVLAPDFTSRLGGTRTPGQMAQAVGQLSPNLSVQDARAAFAYLQKDPEVDAAKISTVGYGWGGRRSFMLAISVPELYRAVVYCGSTPSQSFDAVHAPVLAHYAQYDFRVTGNALLTEKAMTEAGKQFTYFIYPKVNHGFYDPNMQYNADADNLAWTRTLDFLK